MLKLVCDRCDREESNPEIVADAPHPMQSVGMAGTVPARVRMPDDWMLVDERHLCKDCSRALEQFLEPIPKAMPDLGRRG